jgi:hypothetical protein
MVPGGVQTRAQCCTCFYILLHVQTSGPPGSHFADKKTEAQRDPGAHWGYYLVSNSAEVWASAG